MNLTQKSSGFIGRHFNLTLNSLFFLKLGELSILKRVISILLTPFLDPDNNVGKATNTSPKKGNT